MDVGGSVGRMKKKLPVGIESFEEFLNEGFYYIDKTMFIADLLRNWGKQMLVQAWHLPIACGNKNCKSTEKAAAA